MHPTRFPYPLVLRSSNKNYATQLAKMGEDNMKTPVWWSRKAVKLENPEEDNNLGYTATNGMRTSNGKSVRKTIATGKATQHPGRVLNLTRK